MQEEEKTCRSILDCTLRAFEGEGELSVKSEKEWSEVRGSVVCRSQLAPACAGAFIPSSMLSHVMLVAWTWPWSEHLCHKNSKWLTSGLSSPIPVPLGYTVLPWRSGEKFKSMQTCQVLQGPAVLRPESLWAVGVTLPISLGLVGSDWLQLPDLLDSVHVYHGLPSPLPSIHEGHLMRF